MTTAEMQTSPWPDSPKQPKLGRVRRYVDTARTAALIILNPSLTIRERLDHLDYQCSPSWRWTLRNWWNRQVSHRREWRRAEELDRRALASLDERIEQAKTDEQFWLIVNDPNY